MNKIKHTLYDWAGVVALGIVLAWILVQGI